MKKKIKNAIFNVWCVVFSLLDYKHFVIRSGTRKPVGDGDDKGDE